MIIGASDLYRTTSQKLPFSCEDSEYPFPDDVCLEGFRYFKHASKNFQKERVHVILPVFVLCKYLYFTSTRAIDFIVGYELGDVVDFSSKAVLSVEEGKSLGYLKFDNQRLDHDEIRALAPYFFYKNDTGSRALRMIGSSIMKEIVNRSGNPVYPDTLFPFNHKSTIKVHGQSFKAKGSNYFMVYGISSIQPDVRDNVEVDSFYCKPFIEENQEGEGKADEKLEVIKNIPYNTRKRLKVSTGKRPTNSFHGTKSFHYEGEQDFLTYDIPVKFEKNKLKNVEYNVIPNFVQKDLKGLSTNLRNYDSESEMLRSVFKQKYKVFDRYDYVRKIAMLLNLEAEFETEYVHFDSGNKTKKINYVRIGEEVYQCMIVSIKYKGKYFYLMEYDRNFTGLLCDTGFLKMADKNLFILAIAIIRDYMMVYDYFWTRITEDTLFQKRFDIQVLTSIKHQYDKKETMEEVVAWGARKTAQRIMKVSA